MLTGVIDPAGAAAAEPGQGMVLLRNISPIRYGIEVGSQGPPVGRTGCSAWLQRGIAECRQKGWRGTSTCRGSWGTCLAWQAAPLDPSFYRG